MRVNSAFVLFGCLLGLGLAVSGGPLDAAEEPAYGPDLEAFAYPFPVKRFDFSSQGQQLSMAYLDVMPQVPNGRVAVLLHGKNFCAATWEDMIRALVGEGYRVIAMDQIGFCKSTKPSAYQFSFQQLAANTRALLASLGVDKAVMIGHSTGGMLAIRYALMYPKHVEHLVLVDPVGLEDWKARGVPPISIDDWTAREMKTTAESMRKYEQATYYAGTWKPDYERWTNMYAGMFKGADLPRVAAVTARIDDMLFTQPVVYELGQLAVPTLLIVGDKDTTAIGKDFAPPDVRAKLGNYPVLAKAAAQAIPGAKLVEFPDLGHAPQMQNPVAFERTVIDWLK